MTDPPKRRFQFRLRTLMIVVTLLAVACGIFGTQAKVVLDRKAMRDEILGVTGNRFPEESAFIGGNGSQGRISWLRKLFGDVAYGYVLLPPDADKDFRKSVRRTFPEAEVKSYKITRKVKKERGMTTTEVIRESMPFPDELPGATETPSGHQ